MKSTQIFTCAGLGLALLFASCSQSPTSGYDSGTETARAIADDEIPAWMAETSDPVYDSNYKAVKEDSYAYNPPSKSSIGGSKSTSSSKSSKSSKSGKSSTAKKPAAKPRTTTYTVKKGDTLGAIARRNGSSVKAIKSANNLKSDLIRINQKLVIPRKK